MKINPSDPAYPIEEHFAEDSTRVFALHRGMGIRLRIASEQMASLGDEDISIAKILEFLGYPSTYAYECPRHWDEYCAARALNKADALIAALNKETK